MNHKPDKGVRGVSQKPQANEGEVLANINTFAITRLVETALVNISRIELIWKVLVAHFDILANCNIQMLRQLSIEALLCIILDIFAYRKNVSEGKLTRVGSYGTPSSIKSAAKAKSSEVLSEDDMDVDENWSGTVW